MADAAPPRRRRRRVYRHSLVVRVTHWINLLCVVVLLMSGLQIFNAHPALYWGEASDFDNPRLAMRAAPGPQGQPVGITTVFGHAFDTSGLFGLSAGPAGTPVGRGFPEWATLPGPQWLAMGRRWHLFFAWLFVASGLVYLGHGLVSGHLRHDLVPSRPQLRRIGHTVWEHLRFRFPEGEDARHYNVLQKLAYLLVVAVLLPLIALAGMAMSPGLDAAAPWLVGLFDGRQSARTVHFVIAAALVLFVLVHVVMVLVSGLWNNLRAMITGWYVVTDKGESDAPPD